MSDNDTLADILSIMRSEPLYNPHGDPALVEANKVLKNYADRIDEATKWECGNSAVLREALDHIEKLTREFIVGNYYRTDYPQMVLKVINSALYRPSEPHSNAALTRSALKDVLSALDAVGFLPIVEGDPLAVAFLKARAALAAPARNCDMYADSDYAFAAWHDSLKDGDIVSVCNAFAWLFAPAEGEEASNG